MTLVFLFILFSFISYFHLKFLSKEEINKALELNLKDSKKFEKIIMDAFAGKADDKYATQQQIEQLRASIEANRILNNDDAIENEHVEQQ